MRRPSVLVVTGLFPPVSAAGVHRVAALCRHLDASGWGVTVITAQPANGEALDYSLSATLPRGLRVLRIASPDLPGIVARIARGTKKHDLHHAESRRTSQQLRTDDVRTTRKPFSIAQMIDWLSWWLHIPDSRTGWIVPALFAGLNESSLRRPSVVFSTAPFWSAHVVGALLAALTRVPFVADFRDPWCGSAFRKVAYRAHRGVDTACERMVLRNAVRVTCAWNGIRNHLIQRYPQRAADITTVWNGFDGTVLESAPRVRLNDDAKCLFLHTGSFYGPRSPVPILQALQLLHRQQPVVAANVKVIFLGKPHYNGRSLESLIAQYDVEGTVQVLPTVPHHESLAILKGADVALLFGQSGDEALASVPAKTYEYIGLGKPVYAIGSGVEVCDLMQGGGCQVWQTPANDVEGIAATLAQIVECFGRNELQSGMNLDTRKRYSREIMAQQLQAVLNDVIATNGSRHRSRGLASPERNVLGR